MTTTKTTQDEATLIAGERGYRVEIHQMTSGDFWDVRLYSTSTEYVRHGYNRRRDVSKADIGNAIMNMLAEMDDTSETAELDTYTGREMTATSYRFGQFTPDDAQSLDHMTVTITTHPDLQSSAPAEAHGPYRLRHVSSRRYVLLVPVDAPADSLDPDVIVYFSDIASVQLHD